MGIFQAIQKRTMRVTFLTVGEQTTRLNISAQKIFNKLSSSLLNSRESYSQTCLERFFVFNYSFLPIDWIKFVKLLTLLDTFFDGLRIHSIHNLPIKRAFFTPTTAMEFSTLFLDRCLGNRHKDDKLSVIFRIFQFLPPSNLKSNHWW